MKVKTLIADDEPHAIDVIAGYLQNFDEIEIVARCCNGIEAFKLLQQQKVDLLFLDIKMPGLNGNELLRSLKHPPKVVFTTAYSEYALEGYDLNVVDYLLKPIPFDRFLKAMEKILSSLKAVKPMITLADGHPAVRQTEVCLYLRVDRKMVKVRVDEIYWVESLKDYIKLVLKEKVLISKQKISLIEELLPEDQFIRIHRSFIVSINKIESYHSFAVEIDGRELPIGRNYKADCRKRLTSSSCFY